MNPLPPYAEYLGLSTRRGDGDELLFYAAQACLAAAVAMTLWSGYEFFRDVWRHRGSIRQSSVR